MVNNFDEIIELLEFNSEDDFYHLQILKRKKEHPELGSNSQVIKTFYVTSKDYLISRTNEIINLCEFHNARAYINLNVRSFEKTAFHALKKITDIIMNKEFKSVKNAYDSVCGEYGTGKNKKWVIDIDEKLTVDKLADIIYFIEGLEPLDGRSKVIKSLNTKNGIHLITRPFNLEKFRSKYFDIDVHKNNPTILYIN